jgi:dCMP deaminase
MTRPSWDEYFMSMAELASTRSTCDRLQAGAVLVKDKRVLATGYNGSPSGLDHCDDVGHLMEEGHCIRTLHAEENTLLQCAKFGVMSEGSTIYTVASPCYHCFKKLVAGGVKEIVAKKIYRDSTIEQSCKNAGIAFRLFTKPDNA